MKIKVERVRIRRYPNGDFRKSYLWTYQPNPCFWHVGTADTRYQAWKAALKAANKHRKEGAK